jgi:hypothetical protein
VAGSLAQGCFIMDIFLPAEMFLVELIGMILLAFVSWKTGRYFKPIALSSGMTMLFLATVVIFSQVTGIAEGTITPPQWMEILLYTLTGLMSASLATTGVYGMMLTSWLFKK